MKYFRGDTLPIVASFDNRKFQAGDVITGAILQREDEDSEYEIKAEVSVESTGEADEVQLEFSREQMYDILGDVVVEIRLVTNGNVEATLQKKLTLERDGIRDD